MFVRIEEIKEPCLKLERELSSAQLDEVFEGIEEVSWQSASSLSAELRKVGNKVLLKAQLCLQLKTSCARCLEEVAFPLSVGFSSTWVAEADYEEALKGQKGAEGAEGAGSFEMALADIEPFDGRTIFLFPLVKEQVLLALPISVLCSESCEGLCTACGSNNNLNKCACERQRVDPRLAKLKEIQLSKCKA